MTLPLEAMTEHSGPRPDPTTAAPRVRARDLLAVALLLGLATGVLEIVTQLLQYRLGLRWGSVHPHAGWMVPLSHALMLLAVAGVLLGAARVGLGWAVRPGVAAAALGTVALASIAPLFVPEIHPLALAVLLAGALVQGARWLRRRWAAAARFARRVALPATVVVGLAGLAWPVALAVGPARAARPAARAGAPNLLLIVLDTVRAQSLSLHGYSRPTSPRLADFAADGVVFDRAIATSSWTLPTHGSLFTGLDPHVHGADWHAPLPGAVPTLAEVLRSRGYRTIGVVANWSQVGRHSGLAQGFDVFDDRGPIGWEIANSTLLFRGLGKLLHRHGWAGAVRPLGAPDVWAAVKYERSAAVIRRAALDRLTEVDGRPFFAFVNFADAHYPYRPPAPHRGAFRRLPPVERPFHLSDRMRRPTEGRLALYDGEIAGLDAELGRLFDELERRGLLENTLVVVTSDHGEEFGEKGSALHANNLYTPTTWVPLVVVGPDRVARGRRVAAPVSLADVPATALDLMGIDAELPGRSLAGCWEGGACGSEAEPILTELTTERALRKWKDEGGVLTRWATRSLIVSDLHFVRGEDGSEELYSLTEDPWEQRDLLGTARGDSLHGPLREALERAVGGTAAPVAASR